MNQETLPDLASCHRCVERIRGQWPAFVRKRNEWLAQQGRFGGAVEKVAENILQVLFTEVLDWEVPDLNHQVGYADLLLTRMGIKYLLIEVKRPDALAWHQAAIDRALDQARRYAEEQKVRCIGVSDGKILYAADVVHGETRPRLFVRLDGEIAPDDLWWLSLHGVYREAPAPSIPSPPTESPFGGLFSSVAENAEDVHPKYHVPARCFAYVGKATDHGTWKLPYLLSDGSVDGKRLPKAAQS